MKDFFDVNKNFFHLVVYSIIFCLLAIATSFLRGCTNLAF